MASKEPVRRSCGYGLVYELAKDKKDKRLQQADEFFLECIDRVNATGRRKPSCQGVGGALMSIGKRDKKLNAAAIEGRKSDRPNPLEAAGETSASR